MHVLKTDVPNIVIDQFPDFVGHFALQDAGESLIDLLPMKRDGLGSGVQDLVESKLVEHISVGSASHFSVTHDMSAQPLADSRFNTLRGSVISEITSFWHKSFIGQHSLGINRLPQS
jgi:hypothetical protein